MKHVAETNISAARPSGRGDRCLSDSPITRRCSAIITLQPGQYGPYRGQIVRLVRGAVLTYALNRHIFPTRDSPLASPVAMSWAILVLLAVSLYGGGAYAAPTETTKTLTKPDLLARSAPAWPLTARRLYRQPGEQTNAERFARWVYALLVQIPFGRLAQSLPFAVED